MGSAGLANLKLDESITRLSGISDKRFQYFNNIGVSTIRDLINVFPAYYVNLADVVSVQNAQNGNFCTIKARIEDIQDKLPKPDLKITEIALNDGTDTVIATFFSKPWISGKYEKGDEVIVFGRVEFNYGFKRLKNPTILHVDDAAQTIFAMYDLPRGISRNSMSRYVSAAISYVLEDISYLPDEVAQKYKLMKLLDAYRAVHFPDTLDDAAKGRRTIKFYELVVFFAYRLKTGELKVQKCESPQDLNLRNSLIIEKNSNSKKIQTHVFNRDNIDDAFDKIYDALDQGKQACILCPLIGIDSKQRNVRAGNVAGQLNRVALEKPNYYCITCLEDFNADNFQAARTHASILQQQKFNNYSVDVAAGNRNAGAYKENVSDFLRSKLDILVCTQLQLEILQHKNLGAVLVEDADRFNMYALNKIRSQLPEGCKLVLLSNSKNQIINNNLDEFCKCNKADSLTKIDIRTCPPGRQITRDIVGSEVLKLVDFAHDCVMAKYALHYAQQIILDDPNLSRPDNKILSYEIARQIKDKHEDNCR